MRGFVIGQSSPQLWADFEETIVFIQVQCVFECALYRSQHCFMEVELEVQVAKN